MYIYINTSRRNNRKTIGNILFIIIIYFYIFNLCFNLSKNIVFLK